MYIKHFFFILKNNKWIMHQLKLNSLTILAKYQRSGGTIDGAIGHHVLYHTCIVAHIRRFHFSYVEVPCPLGHKTPVVLDKDTGMAIVNPWISNLWEKELALAYGQQCIHTNIINNPASLWDNLTSYSKQICNVNIELMTVAVQLGTWNHFINKQYSKH